MLVRIGDMSETTVNQIKEDVGAYKITTVITDSIDLFHTTNVNGVTVIYEENLLSVALMDMGTRDSLFVVTRKDNITNPLLSLLKTS